MFQAMMSKLSDIATTQVTLISTQANLTSQLAEIASNQSDLSQNQQEMMGRMEEMEEVVLERDRVDPISTYPDFSFVGEVVNPKVTAATLRHLSSRPYNNSPRR